ncbi:site-specific integrase [Lentisphaerota bacterium WC36G]|nr:site-specific integrase [Lentisphaerae bacterium WC36]
MAAAEEFNRQEIDRIFDYFAAIPNGKLYCCIFALGLTTGARINEILKIKRGDVAPNGYLVDSFLIHKSKSKKKKKRKVFIIDRFKPYIYDWLSEQQQRGICGAEEFICTFKPGQRIYYRLFYRKIKSAVKFLNIKGNFATHSMRDTFACIMLDHYCKLHPDDALKPLLMLQDALGHDELKSTTHYTKKRDKNNLSNRTVTDAFNN